MEPNITTIMQQKKQFRKSHGKHATEERKQIAIYINVIKVMPTVFVFSIRKIIRPVDADKIGNVALHPKGLGTAGLLHWKVFTSSLH